MQSKFSIDLTQPEYKIVIDNLLQKAWASDRNNSKKWWRNNIKDHGEERASQKPFRLWSTELWTKMLQYWKKPEVEVISFFNIFLNIIMVRHELLIFVFKGLCQTNV